MRPVFFALLALPAAFTGEAAAHHPGAVTAAAWSFDPWVVVPLVASLALYVAGLARLWSRAGTGRGIGRTQAACFGAGWFVLALSLVSPLDALGAELFSAHMVQHELVMLVAAPLFVLSRPLEAWAWGLAVPWRASLAGAARWAPLRATFALLTTTTGAFVFHAIALWGWHVPALFEAALRDEAVHALQHASFLASALAFWWSVLSPRARGSGTAFASVFATMLHTGALGALLTFAPHAWYPAYVGAFGWSALEDQQVGGLVMWVPGGIAYLATALAIAATWLVPEKLRAVRAS